MATLIARISRRRVLALPALALLLVVVLVAAGARAAVSATPLPEIGADELLASVHDALRQPPPVTGEVAASLELGLPDLALPGEEGDEGLSAMAGDQRVRVWRSPDGFRIARLQDTSEQSFVTNGDEAWIWDSEEFRAQRLQVPDRAGAHDGDEAFEPQVGDPIALAGEALAAIDDTTEVAVDRAGRVAGRDTYRLVLTPRTDETLIGRVELDIDGEQRLPLRAAVFARDAEAPSIEVAYTSVSFDAIGAATFDFTPPSGATVEDRPAGRAGHPDATSFGVDRPDVRTFGEGWATVVAVPRPVPADDGEGGSDLDALLPFRGPLFSATAIDGWLLFGFVDADTLDGTAAELP